MTSGARLRRGEEPSAAGTEGDRHGSGGLAPAASVDRLDVAVYTVPTEEPESGGTLQWDSTTMADSRAAGATGRRAKPMASAEPGRGRKLVLWPDTFTNHFHPRIAEAAVEVLEAAGCDVEIPSRPLCCGRPLYDYGMLDRARRLLEQILEELRPAIRGGTPIVGLEPSCVATFRDELPNLEGSGGPPSHRPEENHAYSSPPPALSTVTRRAIGIGALVAAALGVLLGWNLYRRGSAAKRRS